MDERSQWEQFFRSNDLVIDFPEEDFELMSECCIYEVPKSIRQAKQMAYTPQLISIGPFHHGNPKLADMEKQKLRYLKKFFQRTNNSSNTLDNFFSFIKQHQRRIRNCYAKPMSEAEFESSKFMKMILCDAVFIMELFLRESEKKDDFLVNQPWLYRDLEVDLVLLENQLPYFVLEDLYKLASLPSDCPSFIELACNYFDLNLDSLASKRDQIKHFTDLKRWDLIENHPRNRSSSGEWMDGLCSATMLYQGGVKFIAVPEREGLLNINFTKKELLIPPLNVHPYTESHLRNVIALEQCHYPVKAYVCAYVDLMDHLINTDKDVELLVKKGVILNRVGSAEAVADMINKLLEGVEEVSHCYENIARDLTECYNSPLNRAMATLKQVYFNNLLRGTTSLATFLVVVFTFTQTLVAILERLKPLH